MLLACAGWIRLNAAEPLFDRASALLASRCVACHGGEVTMAGFDMTSEKSFRASPKKDLLLAAVRAGKMPMKGAKLNDAEVAVLAEWMAAGAPWTAGATVGAKASSGKKPFWAFVPPVKATPPPSGQAPLPAIDAFIRAKLTAQGLKPNPPAGHRTLIRRLSFDLTGLPPAEGDYALTYAQAVEKYLASPHYGERWARHWLDVVRFGETDGGEHNYERFHAWPYRDYVIDAFNSDKPYTQFLREQLTGDLLAPHDPKMVAATGFLTAGPWDQVQAEINKDKAMAMTQRMDELDDMVTTTFHTFQALTVNCARCHDHKFDPIPTRDYYQLTSVFQGVGFGTRRIAAPEAIRDWEARRKPVEDRLKAVNARIAAIENPVKARLARSRYLAFDRERAAERQRIPLNSIYNRNQFAPITPKHLRLVIAGGKRPRLERLELRPSGGVIENWAAAAEVSPDQPAIVELPANGEVREIVWSTNHSTGTNEGLITVYRLEASPDGTAWTTIASSLDHVPGVELDLPKVEEPEIVALLNTDQNTQRMMLTGERQKIQAELAAVGDLPQVYAVKPVATQPAFVLDRGSVSKPGAAVVPAALSTLKHQNHDFGLTDASPDAERRRKLADWLTHPENPLTARVIANRIWYFHFGNGIVNTPSDFGVAGDRPSHPELLDWLAVGLRENNWSLKWLHRQIVTSAAYQQSAQFQPASAEQDAGNRLYWRMPLRRMDAETLRDTLLAAAGNLKLDARGGPSFHLQKKLSSGSYIYKAQEDDNPALWRRSVYRFGVRGGERLMLDSFDCPDPAVATPQRSVSNTPVQALTLLNNPFVLQQAGFIARRIEREAGGERPAQVQRAYQLLYGRDPNAREAALGAQFLATQPLALYCRTLVNANEFLYVP